MDHTSRCVVKNQCGKPGGLSVFLGKGQQAIRFPCGKHYAHTTCATDTQLCPTCMKRDDPYSKPPANLPAPPKEEWVKRLIAVQSQLQETITQVERHENLAKNKMVHQVDREKMLRVVSDAVPILETVAKNMNTNIHEVKRLLNVVKEIKQCLGAV